MELDHGKPDADLNKRGSQVREEDIVYGYGNGSVGASAHERCPVFKATATLLYRFPPYQNALVRNPVFGCNTVRFH